MDTIEGGKWLQRPGPRVDARARRRRCASASWRTSSAASSTAIPTARSTRRPSPARPSTAPCTRATSPASRSSTGWPSRSGARDVRRLEEHRAVELIAAADGSARSPACCMLDMRTGELAAACRRRRVLLATGGGPTMYHYHTPSGDKTCDGLAMALRAGLPLRDMEMVQFHPTGLLAGPGTRMTGTVLEEGLRGAGGYLLNGSGERFMYALRRARRARHARHRQPRRSRTACAQGPRDAERRRLDRRWRISGRTTCARSSRAWSSAAPTAASISPRGRVEVVPTAHYMMGGVVFDADCTTDDAGPLRGRRGHRRRARRQPPRRQRRRQLDRVRRHRRRRDGAVRCAAHGAHRRSRSAPRSRRALDRARGAASAGAAGDLNAFRERALRRDVGRRRHPARRGDGLRRGARSARRPRSRRSTRPASPTATAPSTSPGTTGST